jgi:hypothetical protein
MTISSEVQLIQPAKSSKWRCYMFGNRPGGTGIVYHPAEGRVPNRFVRWMMRLCFDCVWQHEEPKPVFTFRPTSEENLDD